MSKNRKRNKSMTFVDEKDFSINTAQENYQKYLDDLSIKQNDYKKQLCRDIQKSARKGFKNLRTLFIGDENFITEDYLLELQIYFKEKGFKTEIQKGVFSGHSLVIKWED